MPINTRKISNRILNLSLAIAASTALLFALLSDGGGSAQAQTADTPTPEATAESGENFGDQQLPPIQGKLNPPQYPNMDSNLNRIVQQARSGQFTAQAAAANAPVHSDASVAVTLYITEGYAQDISDWLEESDASPRNIGSDYIEAYVPVSLLAEASQMEGVISVRTIIPPQPAQGAVVSEGVAVHGVPAWHTAGLKGHGVRIGVIDVGFENFRSLMGTELPVSVEARCYIAVGVSTNIIEDCTDSNDHESTRKHGTAVTEAIFDIAPDATYYIANTYSYGDLLNAVQWMIDHDVDVINHSVGWALYGPGDGTSPYSDSPLYTVNAAVSGGITWINSAGNSARTRWTGAFINENFNGTHEFAGDDECANITVELEPRERFSAQIRWDDAWSGASSDLDLYLIRPTGSGVFFLRDAIKFSEEEQAGAANDIPYERISFGYGSIPNGEYCLAVNHFGGAAPAWIQLQASGVHELEHYVSEFSIGNPAESTSPGMLAVGAARWTDIGVIESFSSRGPTNDGRFKPDIVGADGGQSVTYRSKDRPNGNWHGTSQASPHVAGMAVLVKQRFPNYSPQQVTRYLKNNAEARGATPNNTWGYGFAKLPVVMTQPTPVPSVTPTATPLTAPTVPPEVLNRISALETLVATLQSLISTLQDKITSLDGRVTALETNASAPTPIPTATLTPTPTTVQGAPTPTPTPPAMGVAGRCVTPITGDGIITASWISTCQSTNRPLDPDKPDDGTYYARYYTFDINTPSTVTISMESSEDTFLYLLHGKGKTGSKAARNDDIEYPDNSNSRIEQPLEAGSYTIEAATYNSGIVGSSFTLTVSGIE